MLVVLLTALFVMTGTCVDAGTRGGEARKVIVLGLE